GGEARPGEAEGEEGGEGPEDEVGEDGHARGNEGEKRAQYAQTEPAEEDAAGPPLDEEGLRPLGEPTGRRRARRGKEYAPGHFRDSSRGRCRTRKHGDAVSLPGRGDDVAMPLRLR